MSDSDEALAIAALKTILDRNVVLGAKTPQEVMEDLDALIKTMRDARQTTSNAKSSRQSANEVTTTDEPKTIPYRKSSWDRLDDNGKHKLVQWVAVDAMTSTEIAKKLHVPKSICVASNLLKHRRQWILDNCGIATVELLEARNAAQVKKAMYQGRAKAS